MELNNLVLKNMRVNQLKRWHYDKQMKMKELCYFGQLPMLEFIKNNPGCNQKMIADKFACSRAAVTKSIKRMQTSGVVLRQQNEDDVRKFKLYITKKGEALINNTRNTFDNIDKQTFKDFSNQELELLSTLFDKMINNLEADYLKGKSFGAVMAEIKSMEGEEK